VGSECEMRCLNSAIIFNSVFIVGSTVHLLLDLCDVMNNNVIL